MLPIRSDNYRTASPLSSSKAALSLLALLAFALASDPTRATAQQREPAYSAAFRLGMEADDNAYRVEEALAKRDFLTRYFTAFDAVHPVDAQQLISLNLRHGGKLFLEERDADTLLTQLDLGYRYQAGRRTSFNLNLDIKDRTERLSLRDYNRGGARLGTNLSIGSTQIGLNGGWRYFAYKPNPLASSHGPQGQALMRWFLTENLAVDAGYTLAQRSYDTPVLQLEGDVLIVEADGLERTDVFHALRLGTSLRWHFFVDIGYVFSTNTSNSYGNGLVRHGLELNLTAPLFWQTFLSLRGELQRTLYADAVLVDEIFIVDEENRNSLVFSLARNIFDRWEAEARYSLYRQEFGVGDPYARQTMLIALGYVFD